MQLKELSVSSHQQQAEAAKEEKQISFHPSYLYLQRGRHRACVRE